MKDDPVVGAAAGPGADELVLLLMAPEEVSPIGMRDRNGKSDGSIPVLFESVLRVISTAISVGDAVLEVVFPVTTLVTLNRTDISETVPGGVGGKAGSVEDPGEGAGPVDVGLEVATELPF
jgi:hypothetical protein